MPPESPFREEDLNARVEALRAERLALSRQLVEARRRLDARGGWRWGWFLLGVALFPALLFALLAMFFR